MVLYNSNAHATHMHTHEPVSYTSSPLWDSRGNAGELGGIYEHGFCECIGMTLHPDRVRVDIKCPVGYLADYCRILMYGLGNVFSLVCVQICVC